MTDELDELRERVESLEERIDQLEQNGSIPNSTDGVDQYDGYVLAQIRRIGSEPSVRKIVELYQEAGVRDRSKIKQRHKFLKRTGRIEEALEGSDG